MKNIAVSYPGNSHSGSIVFLLCSQFSGWKKPTITEFQFLDVAGITL
ncbi:hypothetical protein H6F93_29170 [Leptolyngbya sp. FACHB-671]|nr:hypothetical protein [Leptolyngbya sp. FACHB-671]